MSIKKHKIFDEDYINVSISQPSNAPGVFIDKDVNEDEPKVDKDVNEVGYDWPLMSRLENNDFINQLENLDQDNILHKGGKIRKIKKSSYKYQLDFDNNNSNIYEPKIGKDDHILESLINYIMEN